MGHLISEELDQYRNHGFCIRQDQFAAAELSALQEAVDQAAQDRVRCADTSGQDYFLDGKRFNDTPECTVQFEFPDNTHLPRVIEPIDQLHPLLNRLVDDPRLFRPMQSILECTDLALWTAKLNLKYPQGAGFGWHQDSPYWIHDSTHVDKLPNVMLLLDDQSRDNGCFQLIPGSHKQGILSGTSDGSDLGGFYTNPESFDESNAFDCNLPAGSLIFFDPHIVHGSQVNQSRQQRRAVIYTYQPGGHKTLKQKVLRNVSLGLED